MWVLVLLNTHCKTQCLTELNGTEKAITIMCDCVLMCMSYESVMQVRHTACMATGLRRWYYANLSATETVPNNCETIQTVSKQG